MFWALDCDPAPLSHTIVLEVKSVDTVPIFVSVGHDYENVHGIVNAAAKEWWGNEW